MPYFATLDNSRLYYEDVGSGKPIVFVHGLTSSSDAFSPIIEHLRGQYRCVCYDHRGHGASSTPDKGLTLDQLAQDLKDFIAYLDLRDVVLMGHSMGAATVLSYVEQFGCDNIDRIILVDMTPKLVDDDTWALGVYREKYAKEEFLSDIELLFLDAGSFLLKHGRKADPNFVRSLRKEEEPLITAGILQGMSPHVVTALWYSVGRKDFRDTLKRIDIPLACFYPVPGDLIAPEANRYMASAVSGPSKTVEFESCSHMLITEKPEKCAEEIRAFMKDF